MNKIQTNESGYTLIGVIAIFMILSILGISMITLAITSVQTSTAERDDQSAFYIAEAGLNYKSNMLERQINNIYESDEVITENDFTVKLINELPIKEEIYDDFGHEKSPYAIISVVASEENASAYIISSTGVIGDQQRTVSKSLLVKWEDKYEFIEEEPSNKLPPFAVFTNGNFIMSNGNIKGDIGTTSKNKSMINFPSGGPTHTGKIYVPGGKKSSVNNQVNNIHPRIEPLDETWTIPKLPSIPSYESEDFKILLDELLEKDSNTKYVIKDGELLIDNYIANNYELELEFDETYFKRIKVNQNNKLYIDVGDQNKEMIVDHLDVSNGHIYLKGSKNLTIYVTDKITMGSSSTINNNGEIDQLDIFLEGSDESSNPKEVVLSGGQKIFGSLHAEDANITLKAGGGFFGNIFTGGESFKIDGGSYNQAQLFFAPNAYFDMTSGGTRFEGSIIADSYEISGGWQVEYKDLQFSNGPISPAALGTNNNGENGDIFPGKGELVKTGASPKITSGSLQDG